MSHFKDDYDTRHKLYEFALYFCGGGRDEPGGYDDFIEKYSANSLSVRNTLEEIFEKRIVKDDEIKGLLKTEDIPWERIADKIIEKYFPERLQIAMDTDLNF